MAYNLQDRFPQSSKRFPIFEPGAYQNDYSSKAKLNKVPFNAKSERTTGFGNRIWTHKLYHADQPPKIPNCTSMMSKCPRFPYEALSQEDIEAILCNCGIQNVCECSEDNMEEANVICQGKEQRRLFIGPPPRSVLPDGLGAPSKRDHGFKILPDGTHKRIFVMDKEQSPPFYDARVNEATANYQGCKWSQWKSQRTIKSLEDRPGPADYTLEKEATYEEIYAEKFRAEKRKTSKQLRYIEQVQQKEILEARPGPATYNPQYPKGTNLKNLGSQADRFIGSGIEQRPGPADHRIKRDFEPTTPPSNICHAKLPDPAFFGIKAVRFRPRIEEGPSPANYSVNYKQCNILHCCTAGFGSSNPRFRESKIEEDIDDDFDTDDNQNVIARDTCSLPTWEFKSKTKRFETLTKKPFERNPDDHSMPMPNDERSLKLQYQSPFYSSEGRFQPWYDWMTVLGKLKTPGPGYYNLEKPRCLPAVCHGPLYRADRFPAAKYKGPSPNKYSIGGGVETILDTHNKKLKNNISMKHKFVWNPPTSDDKLTLEEQITILFNKSIALLNVDGDLSKQELSTMKVDTQDRPKMLRYFLYSHPTLKCN